MLSDKFVMGIGNAVLDVFYSCSEKDICDLHLKKGQMQIVNKEKSEQLLPNLKVINSSSGGSVANTMAGISFLGGNSSFCGRVNSDEIGKTFIKDITNTGVKFLCSPSMTGPPTAKCQVFVTQDGERTMQTYLGASVNLNEGDVVENFFDNTSMLLIEGYLWNSNSAREAIRKAVNYAKNKKIKIIFSLSDSGLVNALRNDFLNFIENDVDLVLGNENEFKSLFVIDDIDQVESCLNTLNKKCIITLGKNGAFLFNNKVLSKYNALTNNNIVDSTGAGDIFAAGILYKLNQGFSIEETIDFGCEIASKILSQFGARLDSKFF